MLIAKRKKYMIIVFGFIYMIFVMNLTKGSECFSKMGQRENWKKYLQIFRENKLPLLDKEKEEKILQETERILREERSLFSAYLYLVKAVADYENGYLLYGNERIKQKIVELMKMRIQCVLERDIRKTMEIIEYEGSNSQNNNREAKNNLHIFERELKRLVERDGDLCEECYLDDKKEEERKKLDTGEDEGLPGSYSWDISLLYSVAMSCFSGDVYEYLWAGSKLYLVPLEIEFSYIREIYAVCINFATVYAKQFLEDLEKGYLERCYMEYRVCRDEGESMSMDEVTRVVKEMIYLNPEFVKQEKQRLKKMLLDYTSTIISKYLIERKQMLKERSIEEIGKDPEKWAFLEYTYLDEMKKRGGMLDIYEQVGEKEDIEEIKRLGEGIEMDYPVRETNREGDEKMKERYLQRVKDLQERVKALVDKLSHQ